MAGTPWGWGVTGGKESARGQESRSGAEQRGGAEPRGEGGGWGWEGAKGGPLGKTSTDLGIVELALEPGPIRCKRKFDTMRMLNNKKMRIIGNCI